MMMGLLFKKSPAQGQGFNCYIFVVISLQQLHRWGKRQRRYRS